MLTKEIVKRYENNPILTPDDMPVPCCAVYNSGAVKLPDGTYVMMSRFEYLNKKQTVWTSRSTDGIHFTPDPEPVKFVCKPVKVSPVIVKQIPLQINDLPEPFERALSFL